MVGIATKHLQKGLVFTVGFGHFNINLVKEGSHL